MGKIISIQGQKGSGKNQVAEYLNYLLNTPKLFHYYWLAKLLHFKTWKHD